MSARTDLPAMPSCTNCGKCCGPAGATKTEAKRIKRYLADTGESWVAPTAGDPLRCGFLRANDDGSFRCGIYPVRPWVCRAFGVVIQMTCPFFPEDATLDYPAGRAVGEGRIQVEGGKLLGEYFEPGYYDRISGKAGAWRLIEL